jgi:hypothetical protein|tara:strand:- start:247 stop:531 length:285 start_codon:yes stop_codon:yes gene_type:complete
MRGKKMFATFTDWEFEDINAAQETANQMFPKMRAAGASSFKATKTGENTIRTMTVWPDAATAQAAIEKMRAAALEQVSGKIVATSAGEIMVDLS